jgi:DNA ligase 4
MVQRASPAENAEFARIVLKDTQVRLGEDVLLRWFHPHARRHYHSTHDLGRLVAQLRDPTFSMDSVAIAPGNYAAVMLTARPAGAGLAAAARRLATGVEEGREPFFYVEPKLDGERVQLHKMGARVQTFTRSRKDSSEVYAKLLSAAVCASVQAEDCILDGEVVLWDETALKWVTFEGMRPTVARMNARTVPAGERYKLKYCVFDVLYVKQRRARGDAEAVEPSPGSQPLTASTADSLDLSLATASPLGSPPERAAQRSVRRKASNAVVGLPLWQRRKLLDSIVQDRTTSSTPPYAHGFEVAVEKVPVQLGRGEAGLVDWLAHFLREGHEGLIAKSPAGEYGMAERDPAKGIKLKPDYFDGGLQDVDVVILGGKYGTGQGRRRGRVGTLSSFLVGVRTESSDEATGRQRSGEVGRWTPVGSVGTGYSLEELRVLQKRLEPHWQDMERVAGRDRFPPFWDTGSQADAMFCDVAKWIDPRKSAVLQVRAYELARRTGYALRFPRCDRIRDPDEKPFYDAISLEELVELDNCKPAAVIRTSGGQDEDEVVERGPVAKRRRNMTARARAIAGLQADKFSVPDIRAEDRSQALAHHCFHVFASPGRPADADAKHELERRIFLLGGTFDQNKASGKVTHYMARDAGHADVVAICRAAREGRALDAGAKSIVRPEWLGDCEAQNAAVPLKRGHVLLAGRDLERRLLQHADAYGDPWTEATTADTFLACMAEMEARVARGELDADVAEDDPQIEAAVLDGMRASGAVFWGLVAWVPPASRPPPLLAAQLLFKLFGGDVVAHGADAGHPPVTHVLLAEATSPDQCDALRAAGHATAAPDRVLVSDVWVQVCADRERLVAPFVQRAPKFTKAGEC